MTPAPAAGSDGRSIWALRGGRRGDDAQVEALASDVARELGWSWRAIDLRFNPLRELPNALLGATLTSLTRRTRDSADLSPPWPELVIGAGRRSVPAARWIQARTGGRAKLVRIGRPRAPLGWFDLIATTPQYGMPEAPNVVLSILPYGPDPEPERARSGHVALALGGPSWSMSVDAAFARRMAAVAMRLADGRSILAATAPRTPSGLAEVLREALPAEAEVYDWRAAGGRGNPYPGMLAGAAATVVSGDSVSMIADAVAAGGEAHVLTPPRRPWLRTMLRLGGAPARRWMLGAGNLGVAAPPPDPTAVLDRLVALGRAETHDGRAVIPPGRQWLAEERAELRRRVARIAAGS